MMTQMQARRTLCLICTANEQFWHAVLKTDVHPETPPLHDIQQFTL